VGWGKVRGQLIRGFDSVTFRVAAEEPLAARSHRIQTDRRTYNPGRTSSLISLRSLSDNDA
jgi:hypothetical protein